MSLLRNQRITRLDRLVHPARIRRVGRGLVLLVFLVSNPVGAAPTAASQGDPAIPGPDLFFERNLGQFPASVRYLARGPGYHVLLDDEGAVYDLGALDGEAQVRLTLDGGRAPEALVASSPLPGRLNYYLGNEPASWVAGAPTFGQITLREVYDGIDVVYRAADRRAEYDFVLAPGADGSQIAMSFEGARSVSIDAEGRLVVAAGDGRLVMAPPVAYQDPPAGRANVEVVFTRLSGGRVGFEVGRYDETRELVIDPVVLEYSTRLGGSAQDVPTGLQVGSDGTIYVSGRTLSADFLGGPGSLAGMQDVFVSRLSADGSQLLYTTFFGGSGGEFPLDLAVSAAGDAFVVTYTPSDNLPMVNAFEDMRGGMTDYALLRLDGSGALVYSTYYGGPGEEGAFDDGGIALAPNGDVYITGRTLSLPPNGIPLQNHYQSACTNQCAFVAGFDTDLSGPSSHIYGSYVGGNKDDGGQDIGVDAAGRLYVFGFTDSDAGLVDAAQAFQAVTNNANDQDNFLVVLDTGLTQAAQRVYSSYLGSPGAEAEPRGRLFVESASAVFLTGATDGAADTTFPYDAGFPIKNAVQSTPGGGEDAYLAKVDTTTTGDASLVFSTFLGGAGNESGADVVSDSSGTISVALDLSGWTDTVTPLAEFSDFTEVSLVQLDATGQTIETAVPLPDAFRVTVDANDRVLVAGDTDAVFPEVGQLPPSPAGGPDVFLARFESLPLSGATLDVDSTTPIAGVSEPFAYLLTLVNNGNVPITDFDITGGFPGGLALNRSALCFGSITCEPADPADFTGSDAIQPNERLTLFVEASSAATGSFDVVSLTATTTPVDPDASDNSDGTDVDVVTPPPVSTGLSISDFDAVGQAADTGGFAIDTPRGVLATANGVLDDASNLMVFDGSFPVFVGDLYSRGKLAIGVVERNTWTPSDGDGISLLDIDSGFGTVDRVYLQVELVGRGPIARVQLRSGNAFNSSVMVPGQEAIVGLELDKSFDLTVDAGAQTASVVYGGQTILSGNPFSTVLPGGADVGDIGDDMVISVGNARLDLGGALFSDVPIPVPEPATRSVLFAGAALLAVLALRRAGPPRRGRSLQRMPLA